MKRPSEPTLLPAHIMSYEDVNLVLDQLNTRHTSSKKTIYYNASGDYFDVFPDRIEISSNFIDSRYYKIHWNTDHSLIVEKFRPAGQKPRGMGDEDYLELGELWLAIKKFAKKQNQAGALSKKTVSIKLDQLCRLIIGQEFDIFASNPEIKLDGLSKNDAYDFLCHRFSEAGCLVYFEWKDWLEYGLSLLLESTPLRDKRVSELENLDRTEIYDDLDFSMEILRRLNEALNQFGLGIIPFSPARDEGQTFVIVPESALKKAQVLFEELDL